MSSLRVLIDSGADVNEVVPNTKSTPLHLIAQCYNTDSARSVIQLLLDANAHIDCIDKNGLKPEDVAWTWNIRMFLQENRKLSLKCQCARLINAQNLSYISYLSPTLINFVRMHSKDSN